ncbi:MAG: polysaccharide biosynthesis tyrosine autokinase [Sedimentisphaerales bacterium]|nr:polysaccharide biosynthesis tyrosine autokinase [Sedimentisphaerales bacterium]
MRMYDIDHLPAHPMLHEVSLEQAAPAPAESGSLVSGILRRWPIILVTFILLGTAGVAAVWRFVQPKYRATAAIRVAPILSEILFSDQETEGVLPMYQNFMFTQAELMVSEPVLQKAADDLSGRDLSFFQKQTLWGRPASRMDPYQALQEAIRKGVIEIKPGEKSELVKISVTGPSAQEAEWIANAILDAYNFEVVDNNQQSDQDKQYILQNEQTAKQQEIDRLKLEISNLAKEFGSTDITGLRDITLNDVAELKSELRKVQTERRIVEAKVKILEQSQDHLSTPANLLERRQQFLRSDPEVQTLTQQILLQQQTLEALRPRLAAQNPELQERRDMIETLKNRQQARQQELETTFDETVSQELTQNRQEEFKQAQTMLAQLVEQDDKLVKMIAEQEADAIKLGRKHLEIQEKMEQLALFKDLYDEVRRKLEVLKVENKRPARISRAFNAYSIELPNKRNKLFAASLFVALASGIFLSFIRHRSDHRLRTPEDIIRRIGVPVIGTMTSPSQLNKKLLPQQVANEYQTIRANIGLLSGGQIPNKLVITSASASEGKTTFSINLATSLAKAGSKVLLLDGDLRKPDVGRFLHIPEGTWGLADVLFRLTKFEEAVYSMPLPGLDVLCTDGRNASEIIEFLSKPHAMRWIDAISQKYDHIIIDTPPILTAPDAMLWAKLADAVVLCSFAGQSESPNIKEALQRLRQINVKILGNVLNNVRVSDNYYRYGYGYYGQPADADHKRDPKRDRLLMAMQNDAPQDG